MAASLAESLRPARYRATLGAVVQAAPRRAGRESTGSRPVRSPTIPPVRRVAYFGPAGTFTEEALLTQPDLAAGERTAVRGRCPT